MSPFNDLKLFLIDITGLAKDALHIYVAIAVFLSVCLVFGWRAYQWRVLFVVLIVAVAGEALDLRDSYASDRLFYPRGHLHDLWNTMLVPFLLFLTARFTKVFEKPPATLPDASESGNEPEV